MHHWLIKDPGNKFDPSDSSVVNSIGSLLVSLYLRFHINLQTKAPNILKIIQNFYYLTQNINILINNFL